MSCTEVIVGEIAKKHVDIWSISHFLPSIGVDFPIAEYISTPSQVLSTKEILKVFSVLARHYCADFEVCFY